MCCSALRAIRRRSSACFRSETQRYIAQALTDVDLFSSYGLTQKASHLLENVLQRAPRHTATLERLLPIGNAALYRAGADRCRSLLELRTDPKGFAPSRKCAAARSAPYGDARALASDRKRSAISRRR